MQLDDNFAQVSASTLHDPVLRIVLREGRFDLDNATHTFVVEHEPGVGTDAGERDFSLSVVERSEEDDVVLELNADDGDFRSWRRLLAASSIELLRERPDELIEYIVRSTLRWYSLTGNSGVSSSARGFAMLLRPPFARLMPSCQSHRFDLDPTGNVVLARLERDSSAPCA